MSSPPDALSPAQKKRWLELFKSKLPEIVFVCHWTMSLIKCYDKELFSGAKTAEDPHNIRARGELRKLQKLADLASGKQE